MADITIVLTFDDGPSPYTKSILDTLENPGHGLHPIKAAFFVQTHAPYRMNTTHGDAFVKQAKDADHVIGIHTGSTKDHQCHTTRVKQPADTLLPPLQKGTNGLDSVMIRAKDKIAKVTGVVPTYVRAPFGYVNPDCIRVYGIRQLKHIYWDVVSHDADKGSDAGSITKNLEKEIKENVRNGNNALVVLFHDIKKDTKDHLGEFIWTIKTSAEHAPTRHTGADAGSILADGGVSSVDGGTPTTSALNNVRFTESRSEIEEIFNARRNDEGDYDSGCPLGYR